MHTVGHIIDHQSEVDYSHLFVLRAYHEVVWFDISVQVIFTVKVPQTLKGLLCYLFQRNPPLLIFIFKVILERTINVFHHNVGFIIMKTLSIVLWYAC